MIGPDGLRPLETATKRIEWLLDYGVHFPDIDNGSDPTRVLDPIDYSGQPVRIAASDLAIVTDRLYWVDFEDDPSVEQVDPT